MEFSRSLNSKIELLLVIYAFFSPCVMETEIWGIGEHYALDAVVRRFFIVSLFWAFESISAGTLSGEPNSTELIFPHSASPLTASLWLLGCLSLVLVWMVLKGHLSRKIGFILVIILFLLPLFVPGITTIVEESYTHSLFPLPMSQGIGIIILMVTRKQNLT
jgi:hypothetical protein